MSTATTTDAAEITVEITDTSEIHGAAEMTDTTDTLEAVDTGEVGPSIEDPRDAAPKRESSRTVSRHGHRRAPKKRRAPVRLLLGIVRVPGWLVRNARPSRLPWYGAVALGALIVAALVVNGLWWQSTRSNSAENSARGDALVAATSAAQKVLSFDYRTINADVARAKASATGDFLTEYELTSASLVKEVGPAKAIVQASVQSGSVISGSKRKVVVLLFVDQASVRQDSGQKTPVTRIDQARVQMTMVEQHGRWLVSELSSL